MYKVLLLCTIYLNLVLATTPDSEDAKKCMKLYTPRALLCCKKRLSFFNRHGDVDLKDCFRHSGHGDDDNAFHEEHAHGKHSCERETCVAQKHGILADDGTIDEAALKREIERKFSETPEIIDKVKESCVERESIKKYGHEGMCDLVKVKICMLHHIVGNCPEWSDSQVCSEIKQLVEECKI